MNVRKRIMGGILVVLAGVVSYSVGAVVAQDAGPRIPAWVRADGTIDQTKMPSCFAALNAQGETARDTSGRPVCVPTQELMAPPSGGPTQPNKGEEISRRVGPNGAEEVVVPEQHWAP